MYVFMSMLVCIAEGFELIIDIDYCEGLVLWMILKEINTHSKEVSDEQEFDNVVLANLCQLSEQTLDSYTIQEITRIKQYTEQKVYLSYNEGPNQYLLHMFHQSQIPIHSHVTELVTDSQNKVTDALNHIEIIKQGNRIHKIQNELSGKIEEMKSGFDNLSPQAQQQYEGYMQFGKKGHWHEQSPNNVKAKQFIRQMRKKRKEVGLARQKNFEENQKNIQKAERDEIVKRELHHKRISEQIMEKREKDKSERERRKQEDQRKLREAESVLRKFRTNRPLYLTNEEKFRREVQEPLQAEFKHKLAELKKSRRPIDAEELQLHQQKYEEFHQKLVEAWEKREQEQEFSERNMGKLKQLYHGHFHQLIEQQANQAKSVREDRSKQRDKWLTYDATIKEDFKPKIDHKKQEQLEYARKQLEAKSQRGKKRTVAPDGSLVLQDISPDNRRLLGVAYLSNLKKLNEGRKRPTDQERRVTAEERSNSMMQLGKKKIVYPNYLLQMREKSKSRMETAHSNYDSRWRKIVNKQGYSDYQKYNSVMDHVQVLESSARNKQLELKHLKNSPQSIEVKEKLDKYYLESVAAKMTVLKDIILKQ